MKINNKLKYLALWLSALCVSAALVQCTDPAVKKAPAVSVSIEPQRWLLEQIVGDKMEVHTLLAKGGDPESYEPTFANLMGLENSLAYFRVGNLGFEDAIIRKVKENNPDLRIYNTSDSIALIYNSHGSHTHEADPHTWSSVKNAKIMAANMLRAINETDPVHADFYTENFITLSHRLDSIDAVISDLLTGREGTAFMVWHPSLSYFARDYGLKQIALGAEGKEASVADTRRLIDSARDAGAGVFFVQKDFDRSQADPIVADRLEHMNVVIFSPVDYEWDSELLRAAHAIADTQL